MVWAVVKHGLCLGRKTGLRKSWKLSPGPERAVVMEQLCEGWRWLIPWVQTFTNQLGSDSGNGVEIFLKGSARLLQGWVQKPSSPAAVDF